MVNILITEQQYKSIQDKLLFESNLNLAKKNWESFSKEQKEMVKNIVETFNPGSSKILNEAEWYNLVGDILGIVDPTGIVDIVNGISYFSQGDQLFGLLSIISAIPLAGDVVAKPVMSALKIGSNTTKGLKGAMELAKLGKTAEAAKAMGTLAKEPGIIGKFLRSAESWAPKVASKIEQLPGGVLKGFKNTILDYLKLFERAGIKSAKVGAEAAKIAKNVLVTPAKQIENIKALQNFMKTDKIWQSTNLLKTGAEGLTKRGVLSQIFLGGAPRLFGNRRMRILMRQTKWWLGFLDYIGMGNFVGPEELSKIMSEGEITKKMDEYNQTNLAKEYAQQDFGNGEQPETQSSERTNQASNSGGSDPLQSFFSNIFTGQMGKAAIAAF